jgi:hypothetical protein
MVTAMKVYVTEDVLPDVRGPQSGERLTDHTYGIFHSVSSDDVVMGRKLAITISLSKYLKDRDRIIPAPHEGSDALFQAEPITSHPMVFHCFGTLSSDAGVDHVINSADIREQRICSHSGHKRQG